MTASWPEAQLKKIKDAREKPPASNPGTRVVELDDHTTLIIFAGYIDSSNAPDFRRVVESVLSRGASHLVCDLERIDYLGSAGAGIFIESIGKVQAAGGQMSLLNPSDKVMDVFMLLGIHDLFQVVSLN